VKNWHEVDAFWEKVSPFLFPPERWEGTPDEVNALLQLLELEPGASVLDMGCGPGRHSLELARRGYQVTGVDRTRYFLDQARARADQEGLNVEFMEGDIRDFSRPGAFDAALSMFTTFGYFADPEENLSVLSGIFHSLKEGGSFILEMTGKEVLARIFQERDWEEHGELLLLEERKILRDWSWVENRWILIDGERRTEYNVSHWIYSASEIQSMLEGCGFSNVSFYGALDGSPYDLSAKRLIAVARK
jgi:SAM-dependent methyltransferase